jgi:hypothetical protein
MANEINPSTKDATAGVSNIQINPIDVVEKLGKYQFVYDYSAFPTAFFNLGKPAIPNYGYNVAVGDIFTTPVKQVVTPNQNAQVGIYSKGNIVNVVRFQGNDAIIENVNYKEPDPKIVKSVWGEWLGGAINKREFQVPKEYLKKANDAYEPTLFTGINYGANMKPQIVRSMPPVKSFPISPVTQNILEENAIFILAKDFQYVSGYGGRVCAPEVMCPEDMVAQYSTIKAGTEVTGRLFREFDNSMYKVQAGAILPPMYEDYLAVKGYGSQGSINIPVEYLTKEVLTDSGDVVPAENDNKNMLLILGALLIGYFAFNKSKNE